MKADENKLLKSIIALEVSPLPKQDFTFDTIQKIRDSKAEKVSFSYNSASIFLLPLLLFSLFFILSSILNLLAIAVPVNQENFILPVSNMILDILLNPLSIAITISFSLLYQMDVYFKRKSRVRFFLSYEA